MLVHRRPLTRRDVYGYLSAADKLKADLDAKTLVWQQEIKDLQIMFDAETLRLQNKTIDQLQALSDMTNSWQQELNEQLHEQAIDFSHLNQTADQIAAELSGLDTRIAAAIATAITAKEAASGVGSGPGLGAGGPGPQIPTGNGGTGADVAASIVAAIEKSAVDIARNVGEHMQAVALK